MVVRKRPRRDDADDDQEPDPPGLAEDTDSDSPPAHNEADWETEEDSKSESESESEDSDSSGSVFSEDDEMKDGRIEGETQLMKLAKACKWNEASSLAIDLHDGHPPFGAVDKDNSACSKQVVEAAALALVRTKDYGRAVGVLRSRVDLFNWPEGCYLLSLAIQGLDMKPEHARTAAWLAIGTEGNPKRAAALKLVGDFKFHSGLSAPQTEQEISDALKGLNTFLSEPLDVEDVVQAEEEEEPAPGLEEAPLQLIVDSVGSLEQREQRRVELLLRRGAHCLAKKRFLHAEQSFAQVKTSKWANGKKENLALVEYLLAKVAVRSGENPATPLKQLNALQGLSLPEVHYAKGLLCLKMKHLHDAMMESSKALQMILTGNHQRLPWPEYLEQYEEEGGKKMFPEADFAKLEVLLSEQKEIVYSHPSPDTICRYKECVHHKTQQYAPHRREIFEQDDGFKCYYVLHCTERCDIQMHHNCQKHYKDECANRGEEFLGGKCLTPDCLGLLDNMERVDKTGGKKVTHRRKIPVQQEVAPAPQAPVVASPQTPGATGAVKKKTAKPKEEVKAVVKDSPAAPVSEKDRQYAESARKLRALRRSVPTTSELLESMSKTDPCMVDGVEVKTTLMREMCHERLREISMATVGGKRRQSRALETQIAVASKSPSPTRQPQLDDISFYLYHMMRRMASKIGELKEKLEQAEKRDIPTKPVETSSRFTQTKKDQQAEAAASAAADVPVFTSTSKSDLENRIIDLTLQLEEIQFSHERQMKLMNDSTRYQTEELASKHQLQTEKQRAEHEQVLLRLRLEMDEQKVTVQQLQLEARLALQNQGAIVQQAAVLQQQPQSQLPPSQDQVDDVPAAVLLRRMERHYPKPGELDILIGQLLDQQNEKKRREDLLAPGISQAADLVAMAPAPPTGAAAAAAAPASDYSQVSDADMARLLDQMMSGGGQQPEPFPQPVPAFPQQQQQFQSFQMPPPRSPMQQQHQLFRPSQPPPSRPMATSSQEDEHSNFAPRHILKKKTKKQKAAAMPLMQQSFPTPPLRERLDSTLYSEDSNYSECVVCMCELQPRDRFRINCSHDSFHEACLRNWLRTNSNCPLCRKHTKLDEDYPELM